MSALGGVTIALGVALAAALAALARRRPAASPPAASVDDRHEMLAAIVDDAPSATLVLDDAGRVRYANAAAGALFFGGDVPPGASLTELVRRSPEPLRRAMAAERTELLALTRGDEQSVYQIAKHAIDGPDGQRFTVLAAHPLTDELLREEVRAYKRLLRVLSHELNNSLAPVASLASSGQRLLDDPASLGELRPLLATIGERVEHLRTFLGRYAALARLPRPRCADVPLGPLLARMGKLFPGVRVAAAARPAWADEGQLEQLVVNLVKNALEAGSPAEEVSITAEVAPDGRLALTVADAGSGLSEEVIASALVPFFSTKPGGSGLGLAICREIVEGHGGRLRLRNREGGGAEAVVRMPGRTGAVGAPVSWTFTRP